MKNDTIDVNKALKLLNTGESITDKIIDFKGQKISPNQAFQLGKGGVDVPEDLIEYNDDEIEYDPEIDDYEWAPIEYDPLTIADRSFELTIKLDDEISTWIETNNIKIDQLTEQLIRNFYKANQFTK
jgi:hypothetical protein